MEYNKLLIAMPKIRLEGTELPYSIPSNNPIMKYGDPIFGDDKIMYFADPAARVWNDPDTGVSTVYVYCSHDQPGTTNYKGMQDYTLLSSTDMVNWTSHGIIFEPRTQSEFDFVLDEAYNGATEPQMNAPDAAYVDDVYYLYFPYNKTYTGIAKSTSPDGPWEPAITGYLCKLFDPAVFIDDDGQAYIYGNGIDDSDEDYIFGAKLKDNMIELDGDFAQLTSEDIDEGTYVFKRDGIYHFTARKGNAIGYWTATSPLPDPDDMTYHGLITVNQSDAPAHMSFIEFNDKWFMFYHRGDVNDGNYWRRSACFDKVTFNDDGIMNFVNFSLGDLIYIER